MGGIRLAAEEIPVHSRGRAASDVHCLIFFDGLGQDLEDR
jgi:hypothetical protein